MGGAGKPDQQGALDSLCGLYAIVNAVNAAAGGKLKPEQREHILDSAVSALREARPAKPFESYFIGPDSGMIFRELTKAADGAVRAAGEVTSLTLKRSQLDRKRDYSLDEFWSELAERVGPQGRGGAIAILGMGGVHDHWTVVSSASPFMLRLSDSIGLARLQRRACTVGLPNSNRKHQLFPHQTLFIQQA
jgi:hypothetical protein